MNLFAICGSCIFYIGIIPFSLFAVHWWRTTTLTREKKMRRIIAIGSLPLLLIGLLCLVAWLAENRTRTAPTIADLSGLYTTSDRRTPAAVIAIFPDGRYELRDFPVDNAFAHPLPSGTWQILERHGYFEMSLDNFSGVVLHGQSPPYQIGISMDDPDSGEIIFKRFNGVPATMP